jgi:glucose-6-phosphate isomerase
MGQYRHRRLDLGPAMATLALAPYRDGPRLHFSPRRWAHIADSWRGSIPRPRWIVARRLSRPSRP